MKNRIAVNAKYFKSSQAASEKGHVMRLFAEDKNVKKHLSKNNFGTSDEEINEIYESAISAVDGIKKNSNTLVDAVLVFPLEQWDAARKKGMNKTDIRRAIEKTMAQIEQETGLRPMGFKVHLDEGHVNESTGKFELNPHAHLLFANACNKDITLKLSRKRTQKGEDGKALRDPEKPSKWLYERDENGVIKADEYEMPLMGKMPLQYLRGRGSSSVWARMQDLAASNLTQFGFERGISKEITKAKHLTNLELITKKNREQQVFFDNARQFATAAMRGNEDSLKRHGNAIFSAFNRDIPLPERFINADFIDALLKSILDFISPVALSFVDKMNRQAEKIMQERNEHETPPARTPRAAPHIPPP